MWPVCFLLASFVELALIMYRVAVEMGFSVEVDSSVSVEVYSSIAVVSEKDKEPVEDWAKST